jgi:DNA-binding IclR family transcriptional regulator
VDRFLRVQSWRFLTSHARVLLCIARDPGVRVRDVAASLGVTERSAHAIVADLTTAGYLVRDHRTSPDGPPYYSPGDPPY